MNNPIITIAIPTYKRPHRLKDLLDSVVMQANISTTEWEVIVSDNHSCDETQSVVESYYPKISNLRYFQNSENIGCDRNIISIFKKATGEYVWILPDDDLIADSLSVKKIIDRIKSTPSQLNFILLNAKSINIYTNKIVRNKFNPIDGDIYFTEAKDILTVITDFDLIGAQRLIIRKDSLTYVFSSKYCLTSLLSPLALAIEACSSGAALIIGESLSVFRDGDHTPWRVYWPKLCLQDMPELLLDAKESLHYSESVILNLIARRKYKEFDIVMNPYAFLRTLLIRKYGIRWTKLMKLYGIGFGIKKIIKNTLYLSIYMLKIIVKKIYKETTKSK